MEKRKRIAAFVLSLVMVFTMTFSASGLPVYAAKKVTVKKVSVTDSLTGSKKTVYVAKGKKAKLKTQVNVKPNKAANKKVTFKSSNKRVASVDAKGNIKGVKPGNAKITVTSKANKKKKAVIKVKVVKEAVKKVTLNKTKSELSVGASLSLKATVSAKKGAVKQLAWTSSNKKVATVSGKGVVKAVGMGTATITAKAIDGSGKKAVCKVTVSKAPVNMKAINILNANTIAFTLDRPCALTAAQVSVMKKSNANGTYRRGLKIQSLNTTDTVNYTITLNNDDRVGLGAFVQISIPALTGPVKTLEKQYLKPISAYTDDEVSTWTVGEYNENSYSFDEGHGYSKYSVSGLPAGLTAVENDWYLEVKGTPTKPGVSTAVMKAIDEYGNTLTKNIYFAVGSDAVIAGAAAPEYILTTGQDSVTYVYPTYVGGSGNYNYRLLSDPQNLGARVNEDGNVYVSVETPGTYTVTVRATDTADAKRFCDVKVVFHVEQAITIGGRIKDAQGAPMSSGGVEFENKNPADRYCTLRRAYVEDSKGTYSIVVAPGVYDIVASNSYVHEATSASVYLNSQSLTVSRTGVDFTLPLYKVSLVSNNEVISDNISSTAWHIGGSVVAYGSTLYLKPGTYNLESSEISTETQSTETGTWFNGIQKTITSKKVKYTAKVSVVNTAVQVAVTEVPVGSTYTVNYPAAKDTDHSMEIDNYYSLPEEYICDSHGNYYGEVYMPLRVEVTDAGDYRLSSEDGRVKLYDAKGTEVTFTEEGEAKLYTGLPSGTYYVGTGNYDYYDYNIIIETVAE